MSSLDYLDLCRLCLVKDRVSVSIFDGEGDARQIFLKIAACLPVKIARDDKLPKKICDDCVYKVELFYQFWNTTANAEKQLLQWLGDVGLEEKQGYANEVLNPDVMKQEQSENRLDVSTMQPTNEHSNNISINMIDEINLGIPMIIPANQQLTVPISSSNNVVRTVQSVPGPSTHSAHNQIAQKDSGHDMEQDTSEDDNSDDDCDVDEGLAVKEECNEITNNNQSIESTSFVNVTLACDEAGPSGLQQQKLVEMPEMGLQQTSEGNTKSGLSVSMLSEINGDCFSITEDETSVSGNSISTHNNMTHITILNVKTEQGTLIDTASLKVQETFPKEIYECHICNKQFRSKNLYDGHMVAHSDARPYQCDICNKSFKRTNTLAVHRRIHTRERNFICDVCGRAFVQASQLGMHQRRHFEKYACFCEICHKGFFTNAELHGHMNIKHGAKEHVCHACNKSFPNNHTLARHLKIHDPNFKPIKHQCEFCGKIFAYKNSLMVHVKSHTGDNKYDCHICGKSVSSKSSLQDHLRLHSGEKLLICDVCGKAFHKRTTLVVHKRTHTGEKPYSCDTCGKSFTQHSTLVIHKRYHTGQRPYQCSLCAKSFVSRALLNAHGKVHAMILQPT